MSNSISLGLNLLDNFYYDYNLLLNKNITPSIVFELINYSRWDNDCSKGNYINNFNESEMARILNISRNTLRKNLLLLQEEGKIVREDDKIIIKTAIAPYIIINKTQKDIIKTLNKNQQRLALYHIYHCNLYGGSHTISLEKIAKDLNLSVNHLYNIIEMNNLLKDIGLIDYKLIRQNTHYINEYNIIDY